jgi:hypothetical protein
VVQPPPPQISGYYVHFGVKRPGHEADVLPSSDDFQNAWLHLVSNCQQSDHGVMLKHTSISVSLLQKWIYNSTYDTGKTKLPFFFLWRYSPYLGLGLPPWNSPFHFSFLDLRRSIGLLGRVISSSQGLYLYTNTEKHTLILNIHALSGIRTHDHGFRASEDSACLRPLGYRDRLETTILQAIIN